MHIGKGSSMAKGKTSVYFCQNCGYESSKWMGQCPGCKEWNTFVEETVVTAGTGMGGSIRSDGRKKAEVQKQQSKLTEMEMFVTAYCPCEECCGKADGITATGTQATEGRTIAVDPEVIPYGTEVVISGEKYIAEDCGEAIKGRRIDVYFDSHAEAEAYGVKETTCTWVKED